MKPKSDHVLIYFLLLVNIFSQKSDASRRKPSSISARNCRRVPTQSSTFSTEGISESDSNEQIIKKGMAQLQMELEQEEKTVIFLLGNANSGKESLVEILTRNLSELHAVRMNKGQSVIVDESNAVVGVPNVIPKHLVNAENNVSFYDLPSLHDENRDVESDIAAAYFIQFITEHVSNAKFLLVIPHSSTLNENERLGSDFDKVITHASHFLWNMSKFTQSVGLVVSQVNPFVFGYQMEDDEIMDGILTFLEKFHSALNESLEEPGIRWSERSLRQRKLDLVEALLQQNDDDDDTDSNKIAFLKIPSGCGKLSQIPYFTGIRQEITDLYENHLIYSPVSSPDFGYKLRDEADLKIGEFYAPQILDDIEIKTEKVFWKLIQNYKNEFEMEFNSDDGMEDALLKLNDIYSNLANYSLAQDLLVDVKNMFGVFKRPVPQSFLNGINEQDEMLNFYEKVRLPPIFRPSLYPTLAKLQQKIGGIRETTIEFLKNVSIPQILSQMERIASNLVETLKETYLNKFYEGLSRVTMQEKVAILKTHEDRLHEIGGRWHRMPKPFYISSTFSLTIGSQVKDLYQKLELSIPTEQTWLLEKFERTLDMFGKMAEITVERQLADWLVAGGANRLLTNVYFLWRWYDFLIQVEVELQRYQTQMEIDAVRDSIKISNASEALAHLKSLRPSLFSWGIEMTFEKYTNERDKQLLLEIVGSAFSPVSIECRHHGSKTLVTGNFVKVSDFVPKGRLPCYHEVLLEIEVFASQVIYFDKDLVAKRKKGSRTPITVKIMGNRWEVIGKNRTIDISGYDGQSYSTRAEAGNVGSPGNPGTNGGNFYGIYQSIVNGSQLIINLSGGRGGDGQDGGNNGGDGGSPGEPGYRGYYEILSANGSMPGEKEIVILWKRGENGNVGLGVKSENGSADGVDGGNSVGKMGPPLGLRSGPSHEVWSGSIPFFKKQIIKSRNSIGRDFIRTFETNQDNIVHHFFANMKYDASSDLLNLETFFYTHKLSEQEISKEYEEFFGRIENYLLLFFKRELRLDPSSFKILNNLYVSSLSKLIIFREQRRSSSTPTVGNITKYLQEATDKMLLMKESETQLIFAQQRKKLEAEIIGKLAEIEFSFSSQFSLALSDLKIFLNEKTDEALRKVGHLNGSSVDDSKADLKAGGGRLQAVIIQNKLFDILSLVGTIVAYFGELGSTASTVVNMTRPINFNASWRDAQFNYTVQRVPIPSNINDLVHYSHINYMHIRNYTIPLKISKIQQLCLEYEILMAEVNSLVSNLEEAYAQLQNISSRFANKEFINPQEIFTTQQHFHINYMKVQETVLNIKNNLGENNTELNRQLGDLMVTLTVGETNYYLVKFFEENSTSLIESRFPTIWEETVEQNGNMEMRKKKIYGSFIPIVQTTLASLIQQADQSPNMKVGVGKWKVNDVLNNIKQDLKELVVGLKMDKETMTCIDKLDQSLVMLIEFYNLLEIFEDWKQLEIFYSSFGSTISSSQDEIASKLSFFVKANLFLYQFAMTVDAVKKSSIYEQPGFPKEFLSAYI